MHCKKLGTVHVASPTPIKSDGTFDRDGATKLFNRLVDIQIDGVLLLGTMGEGPSLTDAAREALVCHAVEQASEKLALLASVADLSRGRMIERARRYADFGSDMLVVCLTPNLPLNEATADVLAVAEAATVPCLFYHIPAVTGHHLVLDEVLHILSHDNIVGLKDSSGNALLAQSLTSPQYRPDHVLLFDGDEYRTTFSAMVGYDGVFHGGGALTGALVRRIWDAVLMEDYSKAIEMDREKSLFLAQVYNRFNHPLQNILGQKYALKLLDAFDDAVLVSRDQMLTCENRQRIEEAVSRCQSWLLPDKQETAP